MYVFQRNLVSQLIYQAKVDLYSDKITSCGKDQQLFKVVDELLHRKKKTELPDCDYDIDLADKFSEYFVDKISKILKNLDLNSPKSTEKRSKHVEKDTSAPMTSLTPANISEIRKIIGKSASKSSDPVPTWLLKEHLDVLLPNNSDIVNRSLESGVFPDEMKHAMIKTLLKKSALDRNLLKNFYIQPDIPIKNHWTSCGITPIYSYEWEQSRRAHAICL